MFIYPDKINWTNASFKLDVSENIHFHLHVLHNFLDQTIGTFKYAKYIVVYLLNYPYTIPLPVKSII